jgi:hypothetical protein
VNVQANSANKGKHSQGGMWTELVGVPKFVTRSQYFDKSVLADLLFVPPGTTEHALWVQADPTAISTESVTRLVSEATRGWLEENVATPAEIDPASYLFEDAGTEAVPLSWLEEIYSLPVNDDHGLVMDPDDER